MNCLFKENLANGNFQIPLQRILYVRFFYSFQTCWQIDFVGIEQFLNLYKIISSIKQTGTDSMDKLHVHCICIFIFSTICFIVDHFDFQKLKSRNNFKQCRRNKYDSLMILNLF